MQEVTEAQDRMEHVSNAILAKSPLVHSVRNLLLPLLHLPGKLRQNTLLDQRGEKLVKGMAQDSQRSSCLLIAECRNCLLHG